MIYLDLDTAAQFDSNIYEYIYKSNEINEFEESADLCSTEVPRLVE